MILLHPLFVFSIFLVSILISGCSDPLPVPFSGAEEPVLAHEFRPDFLDRPPIGNIRFDSRLAPHLFRALARDLFVLRYLPLDHTHEREFNRIFGISEMSPNSLVEWLETRVRVILSHETPLNLDQLLNPNIVAQNLGPNFYLQALRANTRGVFIDVSGIGRIQITSPRAGIIRWGMPNFYDGIGDFQITYSIFRTSFLFHEGRHSDGNGDNLGFLHVACPEEHDYAGIFACDSNLNGPYTIQSLFLRSTIGACQHCSTRGKEWLLLMYADILNRVLRTPGVHELDPSPAPELE